MVARASEFHIFSPPVYLGRNLCHRKIGIGFSEEHTDLQRMVGWDSGSWGYHGDDGHIYSESGRGESYGSTYDSGNVIGCGVNFERGTAFFTKDGVTQGKIDNIRIFKGC